ncbi:MAG TPA: polymer-forming cytoskeletal protein [Alphaproteobacteria bacterium]
MPSKPDYASAVAGIVGQNGQQAPQQVSEDNRLIVGRNIQLKGEIGACDTLVVEGRVEASMKSRIIQIAESGVFIGEADVETAEIRGLFEGKLTTHKKLVVRAQGRVKGTVRYGTIVIEEGGRVSGDVKDIESGEATQQTGPQAVSQQTRSQATNGSGNGTIGEVPRAADNGQQKFASLP